jgi:hypothetical protein
LATILFLIGALRAIIEMLGLCLLAQGFFYLLAGQKRHTNPVYQLFALLTRPPRQLLARCLPGSASPLLVAVVCFISLFLLWIGLAVVRRAIT